jgi:hypothetical protein
LMLRSGGNLPVNMKRTAIGELEIDLTDVVEK